jgi:hypothetical protein
MRSCVFFSLLSLFFRLGKSSTHQIPPIPKDSLQQVIGTNVEHNHFLQETPTHDDIPKLDVFLKPNYVEGAAVSLTVKLAFIPLDSLLHDARRSLLRATLRVASIPCLAMAHGTLEASDELGSINLVLVEDTSVPQVLYQDWRTDRQTSGLVTVSYVAEPRYVDNSTRSGPNFDLRMQDSGLLGAGYSFLAVPSHDDTAYNIHVRWDLSSGPVGTKAVWTFGHSSKVAVRCLRPSELMHTYFAVGLLQSYTDDEDEVPGDPDGLDFNVYWLGEPPFDPRAVSKSIKTTFLAMSKFFEDDDDVYRVFLRQNPYLTGVGGSGTAVLRSFMFSYGQYDDHGGLVSVMDPVKTIAHEIVHNWVAIDGEVFDNWYHEGMAEYYALLFLHKLGVTGDEEFVQDINGRLSAYYTSPLVNMSISDVSKRTWATATAQRLPYRRGITFAIKVNDRIRQATNMVLSIDDLMIHILRRRKSVNPVGPSDYISWLGAVIGHDVAESDYRHMAAGSQLILASKDSFPAKLVSRVQLVRTDQYMLDYGFDEATATGDGYLVRDIKPDSRAYKAGLRDGDRFTKALTTNDMNYCHKITGEVVREGEDRPILIEYWPRGHTLVEAWQYALV